MRARPIIIICLFLLALPMVFSTGICSLDKFEYHPGEMATTSCFCDKNAEEGAAGFFVWKNQTGGNILRTVATDSLLCRTSIFGDSYTLPDGTYEGNVTFSLNNDGTGSPSGWGDVDDTPDDDFNVTGAHVTDCLIIQVVGSPVKLGELSSVKIKVEDGVSGQRLVNARCQADGYTINSTPILFEPYGIGDTGRVTTASGEVGFQHVMDETIWKVNTNYLYEFHCYCGINGTNEQCYLEKDGTVAGFKSCTNKVIFSTNGEDTREVRDNPISLLALIFAFTLMIGILIWIGTMGQSLGMKFMPWSAALVEFMLMIGFIYISEAGGDTLLLLRTNFLIMLLAIIFFGLINLWKYTFTLIDVNELEDDDKKWKEDSKWK